MYENYKTPINKNDHPAGVRVLFLQDFWTELREGVVKEWSEHDFVKIAAGDGTRWYSPDDKVMVAEVLTTRR